MEQKDNYIQIFGTIKAVLFYNEENGYTVIKLETQDGEDITVVGTLPYACPGEQINVTGEFTKHTVHGEQFKAEWAERTMPEGVEAIFEYLASGALRGVGPATATMIVSEFGARALAVIENEPERLAQIKGISRKKAFEISDAFIKQVGIRRLMELLGNYAIRPIIAIRLFHDYGDKAMELVEENPYIIAGEHIGASFAEADSLALNMGFEDDCAERVAAAALYELWHNSRNGHTFIPADKLISVTSQLIEVGAEAVEEALDVLADSGELVRTCVAEREGCYLSSLYEAEVYTAERIKKMSGEKLSHKKDIDGIIELIEIEQSVRYADLQRYSLKIAAQRHIMVLTGGPGTGKTTTVRAIVSLYDRMGFKTLLTAPTGRAAKRMSELTGKDAATVHRLLEAGYSEQGDELVFRRNEEEPLICDAVILDESSMVDINLMAALLRAMPPECRLVMVGDADQLPSVGPGNVFLDVIRSGIVETVRLTEIFRQGAESQIVANAHMINRGDYPDLKGNSSAGDFFFLRRTESAQTVETISDLCKHRLPEKMGISAMDIQVLTPTRRGETGTRNLNAVLQKALNPPASAKKEKKYGEIVFREGDRVMQTRNNYDIIWAKPEKIEFSTDTDCASLPIITMGLKPIHGTGIFNGDIGFLAGIDAENEIITVLFEDKLASYSFDMLPELEHAFAMTVHKSQGSEFKAVIMAAMDGSPQLMSRSVLYTAVTRARELLIVVGSDATVFNMIDNHKVTRRYSGLRARLTDQDAAICRTFGKDGKAMSVFSGLLDLLYPPRCAFCRKILSSGESGMCRKCDAKISRTRNGGAQNGEFFSVCVSPLYYEGEVRDAILRFKFNDATIHTGLFGGFLADCIEENLKGRYDLITWVPLSKKRLKKRGYDQAMLLAMSAALKMDDVAVELLYKNTDVPAQSGVGSAEKRRANISGVYSVADEEFVRGKRILIIDDIITTGSTLSECAKTLKYSGAEEVLCCTLARTRE